MKIRKFIIEKKGTMQVVDVFGGKHQIRGEILRAEEWLRNFQRVEAELIASGQEISFKKVRAQLAEENINKPVVIEAMIYRGFRLDPMLILLFLTISPLVIYYIYDKRKRNKLAKEGKAPQKKAHKSFRLY